MFRSLLALFSLFSGGSFGTRGGKVAGDGSFSSSQDDMEGAGMHQEVKHTNIRWQINRYLPRVLQIENLCFGAEAWSEEEFIRVLRNRNVIGMVAERSDQIVGYMVYELHKNYLYLVNFAVDPNVQREGVGRAMIDKIKLKLTIDRRNRISLEVREANLRAHLFFKAMGFRADEVLRNYFDDAQEDAYRFVYRHKPTESEAQSALQWRIEG